jgi:uncharacterized Zn-finger protein
MQPVAKPLETLTVDEDCVACDGGGGALGHPRVYLNLAPKGEIECPYCGRRYVKRPGAKVGHGH